MTERNHTTVFVLLLIGGLGIVFAVGNAYFYFFPPASWVALSAKPGWLRALRFGTDTIFLLIVVGAWRACNDSTARRFWSVLGVLGLGGIAWEVIQPAVSLSIERLAGVVGGAALTVVSLAALVRYRRCQFSLFGSSNTEPLAARDTHHGGAR